MNNGVTALYFADRFLSSILVNTEQATSESRKMEILAISTFQCRFIQKCIYLVWLSLIEFLANEFAVRMQAYKGGLRCWNRLRYALFHKRRNVILRGKYLKIFFWAKVYFFGEDYQYDIHIDIIIRITLVLLVKMRFSLKA